MEMWGLQRQSVIKWLQVTGELLSDMKREFYLTVCVTLTWSWTSRAESRISGSRVRSRWSGSLRAPGPTARPDTTPWCYDCETPTASCASPDRENIILLQGSEVNFVFHGSSEGANEDFYFFLCENVMEKKIPQEEFFLNKKHFEGRFFSNFIQKVSELIKKKKKKSWFFFPLKTKKNSMKK